MLNALVRGLGHFVTTSGEWGGRNMDSYREHPSEFDLPASEPSQMSSDIALAIGTDERRMHVRAYNYWVSLLNGRDFPSIEDLEPEDVEDFSAHSVLLDFTCSKDNAAIPYVGGSIREECGLDETMVTIDDVPSRSLLSRLTDHYMQIIANRAPVGFEAEFENPAGKTICYRGILMPFSSDGDTIDFIYGVINWKHVGEQAASSGASFDGIEISGIGDEFAQQPAINEEPLELTDAVESDPVEASEDEPVETGAAFEPQSDFGGPEFEAEPDAEAQPPFEAAAEVESGRGDEETAFDPAPQADSQPAVHFSWEEEPLQDEDGIALVGVELDENAALADRLWAARETAESVKAGEGRTRTALYKALSLAYDFAVAAHAEPQEYAELLEESGVKTQARAPMTPIVKLVFGINYDKARLTEFAAALSYAQRQDIALGGFQGFIEKQAGGLKALVAAERLARRPESRVDTRGEIARARLRSAPSISLAGLAEEFALVVTRRGADGAHEPVAIIDDEAMVERAIRRVV
jgi:hypothetical protein